MARWWTCLALAVFAAPDVASDLLRHVPKEAGFVVVAEHPRKLVETVHVGKDFHAARVGPVGYVSNQETALHAALGLKEADSLARHKGPTAARKFLGGNPLVWGWLDFAKVKEQKTAQDFFAATRKDFLQTTVLGSSIDAFRRADFLSFGLYQTADGFRA